MTKKTLIAITAVVLVLFCTVGATLAWLVDTTGEVKNTFTYGDINIALTETTGTQYKMVPGNTISKDPKVTVKANSEACWLFVKVTKSNNFDKFMTYTMADGWTQLTDNGNKDVVGVFYREVAANKTDSVFAVLKNNKVAVKGTVTKDDFKGLLSTEEGGETTYDYPTLTFDAYAVQKDNVTTAYAAWEIANPTTNP